MHYDVFLKNGKKLEMVQPFVSTKVDEACKSISFFTEKDAGGTLLATVMLDSLSHIVLAEDKKYSRPD